MYPFLRNLHLFAGLFAALFLLAYAVSAAQMAYPIYRPKPVESVSSIEVPPEIEAEPRPLAKWFMDRELRGDLTEVATTSVAISLTIVRPGTVHRIAFDRSTRSAKVTTARLNAIGMLNRIHHVRGIAHDYWAIDVWGWFLLTVSIALLVLALSGATMWFLKPRRRRMGAILFAAGLIWGLGTLVLVRLA